MPLILLDYNQLVNLKCPMSAIFLQTLGGLVYQVLALRYSKEKKEPSLVYVQGGLVKTYEELALSTYQIVQRIKNAYKKDVDYNLFFSAAHTAKGRIKKFLRQEIIPFDIDKVDYAKIESYLNIFSDVTGVPWRKTWVVKTGSGLQIMVRTHLFNDEDYFKKYRSHYKAICKELERRFLAAELPVKEVDTALWAVSKHPRLPFTQNIKPVGMPVTKKSVTTQCETYHVAVDVVDFDWDKWDEGDEGEVLGKKKKNWDGDCPSHDPNFIFQECGFLKEELEKGGEGSSEKKWFAALGVVSHIKDPGGGYDDKIGHAISDRHNGYTFAETQRKIEHCRESTGPRTCESISLISSICKDCKHFNSGIGSPLNLRPPRPPSGVLDDQLDALLGSVDMEKLHLDAGGSPVQGLPIKIAQESAVSAPSKVEKGRESENKWDEWIEKGFAEKEEGGLTKDGKKKKDKYTRHFSVLAEFLQEKYKIFNVPELKRTYWYDDAHYKIVHDDFLKREADIYFTTGGRVLKTDRAELLEAVKLRRLKPIKFIKNKFFNDGLINLKSGVLNVHTREVTPHSHDNFFNYRLDFDYDPAAKCEIWDKFMAIATNGKPHLQRVLEEYMAYIVAGGPYRMHRFLIMYGPGRNGKGTVCKVIQELLGGETSEMWTTVKCSELDNPFHAQRLEGALANISEEEKISGMKDTSALKAMTGESPIVVGRKFENAYPFINRAKLVLTYNTLPKIFDSSEGMKDRPILVPLQYNFERDEKGVKIQGIDAKLRAELPGILNRLVESLHHLQKRGKFEEIQESIDTFDRIIEDSSEVKQWLSDEAVITGQEGDRIPVKMLYQMFLDENPRSRLSRNNFVSDVVDVLEAAGVRFAKKACKIGGRTVKCYVGLVMRDDAKQGLQKQFGAVVSKLVDSGSGFLSNVAADAPENLGQF